LSSAQIINKNVLEFTIVKIDDEYQVFQTQCVQDINYWTKKDTGRQFIDDRLGMLPLKVARMMMNLGKGCLDSDFRQNDTVILDPFCGMGSILQEAIDLGMNNVIGGDINAEVLNKCEKNLRWFCEKFMWQHVNMLMINSDAVKISDKLRQKVDLIVTEPFLGDARRISSLRGAAVTKQSSFEDKKIKNIVKGLERMYIGCLKDWRKTLKPDGIICIIVPEIAVGGRVFTIPFVEICAKVGYNIINSYDYHREKAVVKRKIYILKYQISNPK
jgi:tRNA G10  N-methylase Trm11